MTPLDSDMLREAPTPQPFTAIVGGTLPTAIIATLLLPNWRLSTPFDIRWACL